MYGSEKWFFESNPLKRWAQRLLGELHVPQRLRTYHVLREIRRLGLWDQPVRMLDAGCGRGEIDVFLAKRLPQWEIVGIDYEEEKAELCRKMAQRENLSNVEFHQGNLLELEYEREFDLILNGDVMPALTDDVEAMRRLCCALRHGGYLIITAPSIPQRKHLKLVKWRERRIGFSRDEYGYVRDGYSRQDFEEKFALAGGEVLRSYFAFGFFGTLAFDLFFVFGDNRPNPLIYAFLFPLLMMLAGLDLLFPGRDGSAIVAVVTPQATSAARTSVSLAS